jgi:sterol desaturase/sphingolipid hydroxylase (fatty acid hydroxylase superfamily)
VTTALTAAGLVVAAFLLWSFLEYVLHRFAFHEARGRNYGSREHLGHHARREYSFLRNWEAWVGVAVVGAALALPGWWVAGALGAWSLGLGFVAAYFTYEGIHALAHVAAPRTRYGRWFRRHHFHHHFAEPLRNQGVTTPLWDRVFGTLTVPDQVLVPRRLAMSWLLDEHGEVRPEHRADYAVRGAASFDEAAERPRAFDNLPPLLA